MGWAEHPGRCGPTSRRSRSIRRMLRTS
jgi:hypothetical protein